jgi:hypothetical protein
MGPAVELMYARAAKHEGGWAQARRNVYLSRRHRFPQMVVVDAARPRNQVRREGTALLWNT